MMHRTCLGLSLLLAAQIAAAEEEGVKPGPFAAATRLIQEQVESGLVGAAALLVARNGKVEVEQGFGSLSRKAGAKPCRTDSIFLVASISKPVTAMAVMRLVDQNRICLHDPAQKYLPEFTGDGRERITVRNLLSHTSGLPDMLPNNIELRKAHAPLKSSFPVHFAPRCSFPLDLGCLTRAWAFCWLLKSCNECQACLSTVSCSVRYSVR